jgi:hypothetical protein
MSTRELLDEKKAELAPRLRRVFWLPVRRMLRMFHLLPVVVALIVFMLLATDGQLREIYVSYLEQSSSASLATSPFAFVAAGLGFALISAVIYESHYLLSKAHVDVVYSMNADLAASSIMQDATAIVLALAPWLGLVAGLLHAKLYLADLFYRLQKAKAPDLYLMQYVPMPSTSAVAVGILVLGLVMSFFVVVNLKDRALQRSVILLSPAGAALLFLLLTDPPEFNPTPWQIVGVGCAISAVTAIYYYIYAIIYAMRPHVLSRSLQEKTGINVRKYQRLLLFIWGFFPWVATIGLYLIFGSPTANQGELHGWAMIPVAMSWVISIGLLVVFLLNRFQGSSMLKYTIYGSIAVLAVTGLAISWFSADTIVAVYRFVGPLGSLAFAFLFLISIFVLLAALSQRSGFPALTLVILVLVGSVALPIPIGLTVAALAIVCLAIAITALVSGFLPIAAVAIILAVTGAINFAKMYGIKPVDLRPVANGQEVAQQFASWLDKHAAAKETHDGTAAQSTCAGSFQQYPVYIIAAAGGGIYAASAASVLLARLQDRAPCFAKHVFAISAVSGGAIGSTIFQSLVQSKLADGSAGHALATGNSPAANIQPDAECLLPSFNASHASTKLCLEDKVSEIIQGDHFSPLVAAIFPEFLGVTRRGRAQELTASFEHSVNEVDGEAAEMLRKPFASNWSVSSDAPALVLNATWVENGYRAAFAPFPLHKIDNSLYSFDDQCMPADPASEPITTIDAALVSARFPAILPPYSVTIRKPNLVKSKTGCAQTGAAKQSNETIRWNFVDGGYSDTTGATTALALYQALKAPALARHITLRMVLITSSDPQLQPDDIDGTLFADTLGPIDAMLNVRDGLGNEALARACNAISTDGTNSSGGQHSCENLSSDPNSPLQIVGIEDQTYGLSLGWKISRTTFGVISWMLGKPEFVNQAVCNNQQAGDSNPASQSNGQFTLNEDVVCQNSHVVAGILQSLGSKPQPSN